MKQKSVYVCGPLTELDEDKREGVKSFYERIADLCKEVTGARGLVPHERGDPVTHAHLSPAEIDAMDRKQVCENTYLLVVVAIEPSWGGGIEVEMANHSDVPVVILAEKEKLEQRKISRLLRGNPAVREIIAYVDEEEALSKLKEFLLSRWGS